MIIETGGELKISDDLTLSLKAGERIGVEAERSRKAFEELESILPDLLAHYDRACPVREGADGKGPAMVPRHRPTSWGSRQNWKHGKRPIRLSKRFLWPQVSRGD